MSSLGCRVSLNSLRARVPPCNGQFLTAKPVVCCRRFRASCRPHSRPPLPVYIDSLSETLEAHRAVNRNLPVRKVFSESPAVPSPPGPAPHQAQKNSRETPTTSPSVAAGDQVEREKADTGRGEISDTLPSRPGASPRARARRRRSTRLAAGSHDATAQVFECPWLDHVEHQGTSGLSRLNEELKAFEAYMSQIPQDEEAAQWVQQEVTELCRRVGVPEPSLHGSRKTGFALRHSNVNLQIPLLDPDDIVRDDSGRGPSPTRPKVGERQLAVLADVFDALDTHERFEAISMSHGGVPRVIATHRPTGVGVCIDCSPKPCTQDAYVVNFASEFPTLRRLYTVLRMSLELRELFHAHGNGLSPYALIILIVTGLKLGQGSFDPRDAGEQLMYLLRLYSEANYQRYGFSVEPPFVFRKRDPRVDTSVAPAHVRGQVSIGKRSVGTTSQTHLCLQDPANYMNDLGASCRNMPQIQTLFRNLAHEINLSMQSWELNSGLSTANRETTMPEPETSDGWTGVGPKFDQSPAQTEPLSVLRPAVGGDYAFYERLRDKAVLASRG
ncbi:hypothetical protein VTO42DRAFT_7034 [Malbranchea cinnamomea]